MQPTPSLLETQNAMLAAIAAANPGPLERFVVSDGIGAHERIGIHRNTTGHTLVKALRLAHPAVHRLVGDGFFEAAARTFLETEWPQSALLDEFGEGFGRFLDAFEPAASLAYLGDVARLEWAVHRALHAADATPLDLARLAAVPESRVGELRFLAHPSLAFVPVCWGADEIWRAVIEEDDAALGAIETAPQRRWLIVQRSYSAGVNVQGMPETDWRFALSLCAGARLDEAIAATPGDSLRPGVEELLGKLLADGRFTGFALAADAGNRAAPHR